MNAEGEEIRQERMSRKMSQKDLAQATGVGLRTITRIETSSASKDADSRSIRVLQRYFRIGPFKPEYGASDDPPLSQATFAELLDALRSRYGRDVRDARTLAVRDGGDHREDRSGYADGRRMSTPSYDGARFDDEDDASRSRRPGATG